MQTLDLIYSESERLMRDSKFAELDSVLAMLNPSILSVDIMLGYLTATLPAKSKLPSRVKFFEDCKAEIIRRGEYENGLLVGL